MTDKRVYSKEHKGKIIFLLEIKEAIREHKSEQARTIGAISYERRNATHPHYTMKTLIDLRANQEIDTSKNLTTETKKSDLYFSSIFKFQSS